MSRPKKTVLSGTLKTPIRVAPNPHKLSASKKLKRLSTPIFNDHVHPEPQENW